jgi:thymidylate kinase
MDFHKNVRAAFQDLAKRFADRYVVIDASQSFEKVFEDAYKAIKARL